MGFFLGTLSDSSQFAWIFYVIAFVNIVLFGLSFSEKIKHHQFYMIVLRVSLLEIPIFLFIGVFYS
jgi:hypothetical protein